MEPQVLEQIGLTKSESTVYLALLQSGTSTSGRILKESKLHSGKIYEILESLKAKGLVSESIINRVRHFTAAPPSQLLEYVERKKEELQKDEDIVRSAIPKLEKLREVPKEETKAVTYIGLRGIKTAADEALETLGPGETTLAMGVTQQKDERFNRFWRKWQERRIKKRIIQKMLFSERSEYSKFFKKLKYTEAKILTGITPATIDIFGDNCVLILNYPEQTSCILIYSRNITASFKQFFEQLWKIAKP